jgi:hypothetical protein
MTADVITVAGQSFSIMKPLVGFREEIKRQLAEFPFEKNVFLMMRFRSTNQDLSDFIIETLKEAKLNGVRADHSDWNITNNVYNPVAVLYCCKYGIALFDEVETNQAYNANVIYELGMMHCLRRECLILKNDSLPAVPFDLIKDLYMPYKGELAARANVRKWMHRIAAPWVAPRRGAASRGVSKLEYAVSDAPPVMPNTVVASPDNIVSADFGWRVVSKTRKAWKVSWSIRLTNNRRRPTRVRVQVLFQDASGFALEDHTGSPTRALSPGRTLVHRSTVTMSPDIATRIQRALATVMTIAR